MQPRPQRLLDYREFPILYVDDEPENLRIFELTFRRELSVLTAETGEAGLRLLNERPIAIVLSDQRMPGMLGVDFLARARELDPKTIRILVTAYGDAATLGGAINDGSIYRYVPKPWAPEEMRLALRRAIEVYALDRERDELLNELTTLSRVSKTITQELDLEPLVDLLLKTVIHDLGYDGAALFFLEDGGRRLRNLGSVPAGAVAETLRQLSFCERDAGRFVRRLQAGETQLFEIEKVLELEGPVRDWLTEVAADEMLVIPLVGRRSVIGALAVDNRRGGRSFGVSDRTLLDGFASQAVITLENARLVRALRESRAQVLRADRLGHLGTLAAGLAHEINNPLVAIHTFLTLAPAKRREEDAEFWGNYHALACREVERIRGLVNTMARLARGAASEARLEACDLGELAREATLLLARQADAADVSLVVESDAATPKVVAVRDQIHQLLLNLILNAIQATPAGGRVWVQIGPDRSAGGGARLEVTDTGRGIPPDDLERIFDPFFTTKGPDQGSGLGLMICHRIVSDHGGTIEVESRAGEGASFRVHLRAEPPHE